MKLNNKCCDALGCRNEIQAELNRLNKLLADIMATVGVTSQDDILAAVRGIVSPEWISADLVPPTEPGWYWVVLGYDMTTPVIANYDGEQRFFQDWQNYTIPFTYTRYIKINHPVVKE